MIQPANLADQLLKLEQQLIAYQEFHKDELAGLWRVFVCAQISSHCPREAYQRTHLGGMGEQRTETE